MVRYKMYDITSEIPEDRVAKAMVDGYLSRLRDRFKDVVGESLALLDGRLETIRRSESNLGDFVCDAVRARLGVDAVLLNSGGFRASVQAGPVTVGDVQQVFPFVNTVVTISVTGAAIRAALERGLAENPEDNPGAFLQVAGLRYQIDGRRAANIQIGGAPLDETKTYRIAVNSFMADGGDRFDMFKSMPDAVDTGDVIADLMMEAIRQAKQIEPKTDGRIQRISPWAP
jgi:2',3'-cyclic-nucleotide 2'-phosphodiesterase (5'-nucleotidase family)